MNKFESRDLNKFIKEIKNLMRGYETHQIDFDEFRASFVNIVNEDKLGVIGKIENGKFIHNRRLHKYLGVQMTYMLTGLCDLQLLPDNNIIYGGEEMNITDFRDKAIKDVRLLLKLHESGEISEEKTTRTLLDIVNFDTNEVLGSFDGHGMYTLNILAAKKIGSKRSKLIAKYLSNVNFTAG